MWAGAELGLWRKVNNATPRTRRVQIQQTASSAKVLRAWAGGGPEGPISGGCTRLSDRQQGDDPLATAQKS